LAIAKAKPYRIAMDDEAQDWIWALEEQQTD
jgi:hypothetical protein